ncbi:MAG: hypothetical protein U9N02_04445 [Campylobacterota bacterium]|nr:hypothetical protein [Campylobacterota bacterium]
MEVSSNSSAMAPSQVQVEVMKKEQDVKEVQSQQDLKILEDVTEQSKEVTAQKTGMGGSLNILG